MNEEELKNEVRERFKNSSLDKDIKEEIKDKVERWIEEHNIKEYTHPARSFRNVLLCSKRDKYVFDWSLSKDSIVERDFWIVLELPREVEE